MSTTPAAPARLGNLLIERGYLTREALERALEAQRSERGEKLLGEILVEQRLSTQNATHGLDLILDARQSQRLAQNRVPLCGALKSNGQTSSKLRARRPHGPIRRQQTYIDRLL